MDAKAYLISQGWSGPGNPLNPSRRAGGPHAGLGLTKPILVARKKNTHGIGNKTTHDHTNQWWLRGFEEALKGVGEDGSATPTTNASEDNAIGLRSELYKFFVRGQGLKGTIGTRVDKEEIIPTLPESHGTKRKRDEALVVKNDVSEKQKRKRKKERSDSESSETKGRTQGSTKKEKKKKKKRSTVEKSDHSSDVSSDVESRVKMSDKKSKKKRRDDPSTEASSASNGPDTNDSTTEVQVSEKEARKKRKELNRAKKLAKQELKDKDKESQSRKKKKKNEENDK